MLRAFQRVVIRVMEYIGTTEFGVANLPYSETFRVGEWSPLVHIASFHHFIPQPVLDFFVKRLHLNEWPGYRGIRSP